MDGIAHQAAEVSIAAVGRVDGHAAGHVGEREAGCAVTSHHTTGIGAGGVDSACGAQVLDSGTVGIAERSAEFSIGGIVDGKGIAAAVESALECIESTPTRTSTHHAADADVFRHQEICTTVALT